MPFDPAENERRLRAGMKVTPEERGRREVRRRRFLRSGQLVMGVGAVVGVTHWMAHVGAFGGQPPNWVDLAAGYPAAAVLLLAGGVLAGQK